MIKLHGTSIIEIIIAAALIGIAIIAALSLMNHSQKQNTYAKNLEEASKYTTQAAEWLRTERNYLGYATIANKIDSDGSPSTYCLNIIPSPDFTTLVPGSCADGDYIIDTSFSRHLTITHVGDTLEILISVTWMEQTSRQATIEMELSQW